MTNPEPQAPNQADPQPLTLLCVVEFDTGEPMAAAPAPLPGEGAQMALESTPAPLPGADTQSLKGMQIKGLKRLRIPGGDLVRAANPSWGNPNLKQAAKIKRRRAWYEANHAGATCYHRPGSWKK